MEFEIAASYGKPLFQNRLIQADNVDALDEIADALAGTVRCVYIDPPYNNGEQYAHYSDRQAHSDWLSDIRVRLERLWPVLADDGSIWISIDDGNVHYLKVLADEVFGRGSFISTVIWEHRTTRENRRAFSNNHEYVLVYAKDPDLFRTRRNLVEPSPEIRSRYKNPDGDPRGPWQSVSLNVQDGHATAAQFYEFKSPSGKTFRPPAGRCWAYTAERMQELIGDNRIWFGRDGTAVPRLKRFLSESRGGMTPPTIWPAEFAGTTTTAKREILQLFPGTTVFETPKPEQLLRRIIEIATDPGDLVLDAYLGSGTAAAVAHKLNRCWLGIERGPHAATLCYDRLRRVVDGEAGGISAAVGWRGGGGFVFESLPATTPAISGVRVAA